MKVEWGKVITSKTVWLGILTVAVSIVEFIANQPAGVSWATMVIGILTIVIRFLTSDSLIAK